MNLRRLFEVSRRRDAPYQTLDAELDAVRDREKAMSMIVTDRAAMLETGELADLARRAMSRGLALVVDPESARRDTAVRLFVLHPDEAWRVAAYRALWETAFTGGTWSDAAEAHASLLLGYTAKQRAAWLAAQRWAHVAWGHPTVYALVDDARRARVIALGQRCFGEASAGMHVFRHDHPLVRGAAHLAPRGSAIARFAVTAAHARTLFGARAFAPGLREATVTASAARTLDAALRSRVELLGGRGWR